MGDKIRTQCREEDLNCEEDTALVWQVRYHLSAIISDHFIKSLQYKKKKRSSLQWNQETIHHTKARAKLHTFFSPGRQVESCGRHPMWVQTFIYYLLLQSKDKENEDDYPVTGRNRWSSQSWLNCSLTAARAPYHHCLYTSFWSQVILVCLCLCLIAPHGTWFCHILTKTSLYINTKLLPFADLKRQFRPYVYIVQIE